MNKIFKTYRMLCFAILLFCASNILHACANENKNIEPKSWNDCVVMAIDTFPSKGGYYTGSNPNDDFSTTAWYGLSVAFDMTNADLYPAIKPELAIPSFCSSASYMVLLKALSNYDANHSIISKQSWINLKPYVSVSDNLNPDAYSQDDGIGCWGRANANGPGVAVLVNELNAGENFTAYRGAFTERNKETPEEKYMSDKEWTSQTVWQKAVPGDFMKIFWDRNKSRNSDSGAIIGCNSVSEDDQERGHITIFLGYNADTNEVTYWSSNGPGSVPKDMGYGIATTNINNIQRVVFTHISHPELFDNAKNISITNVNEWLMMLNGKKHGTTAELKKWCGIK